MSLIEVKSVSDLVSAINVLYNAFMSSITYANKKLTITYRNGGTVDIDMSAIITDTNIGELSNIDDTGITDKQILSYDTATNKYIPTTIDTAGVLADAKKYTDDEIAKINNADAISVDEKPTYSNGTITYKKDGVEKTITDGDFWFFYTVDDMAYQTIWIDGVEFTTSVDGSVDFKDFVSKTNDLTSTYTGEETDKTKVTTIASLDALYAIISTALGKKINTADIVDNLSSDATDKPLSAAQGKVLDTKISNFVTTVEEDYAKTTDIPTTLPANGGNADTVNNHTVETNVPINAVFTDTIYDDAEVKESIEELNSNLVQLEYSENGIENLIELMSKNETSNGVTLTNNGDGTLTFNGTSTNYPQFSICEVTLEAGTYKMSSFNYDGANPFLWIGTSKKANDIANGRWNTDVIFTLSETKTIYVTLVYTPNDNPQNKLVKPMIVKGNELPNTFRKYVKSNLQLTDNVAELKNDLNEQGLFKKSTIKNNSGISYESGGVYTAEKTFSTDYINVSGYTKITCNKYSFTNNLLWGAFYDSSKNYISGFNQNSKTITVPNNANYIRLTFMNEDIDDVYICAGVIGDVAEEVNQQNESLDDYGLNNLYHGTLAKQSYINGSWTPGETWVRTVDKTPCKGEDIVSVKTAKTWDMMYILFFESDDTVIEAGTVGSLTAKTDTMSAIAPSNASYFMCQFGCEASGSHPTVNDIIHTYVNNGIDKIKNDLEWKLLADNVAVGTSTNVVSGAREYYVIAKYNTINITTLIPSIVIGKTIFDGYYSSESDNARIQINTTTSALSLASFIYGGSVKDDATYSVYYR